MLLPVGIASAIAGAVIHSGLSASANFFVHKVYHNWTQKPQEKELEQARADHATYLKLLEDSVEQFYILATHYGELDKALKQDDYHRTFVKDNVDWSRSMSGHLIEYSVAHADFPDPQSDKEEFKICIRNVEGNEDDSELTTVSLIFNNNLDESTLFGTGCSIRSKHMLGIADDLKSLVTNLLSEKFALRAPSPNEEANNDGDIDSS